MALYLNASCCVMFNTAPVALDIVRESMDPRGVCSRGVSGSLKLMALMGFLLVSGGLPSLWNPCRLMLLLSENPWFWLDISLKLIWVRSLLGLNSSWLWWIQFSLKEWPLRAAIGALLPLPGSFPQESGLFPGLTGLWAGGWMFALGL